jgi:hypothetical protein
MIRRGCTGPSWTGATGSICARNAHGRKVLLSDDNRPNDLDDARLAAILEDMSKAATGCYGTADLRVKCDAVSFGNPAFVDEIADEFFRQFGFWVRRGQEFGHDQHALEQVGAETLLRCLLMFMRAAKERRGEVLTPGRVALISYCLTESLMALPEVPDVYALGDHCYGIHLEIMGLDRPAPGERVH